MNQYKKIYVAKAEDATKYELTIKYTHYQNEAVNSS